MQHQCRDPFEFLILVAIHDRTTAEAWSCAVEPPRG